MDSIWRPRTRVREPGIVHDRKRRLLRTVRSTILLFLFLRSVIRSFSSGVVFSGCRFVPVRLEMAFAPYHLLLPVSIQLTQYHITRSSSRQTRVHMYYLSLCKHQSRSMSSPGSCRFDPASTRGAAAKQGLLMFEVPTRMRISEKRVDEKKNTLSALLLRWAPQQYMTLQACAYACACRK